MVKLDLEINEIVGLAELGRIDKKKLKKFLKSATKEELEDHIIATALEKEGEEEIDEESDIEEESGDLG